ncbi:MAG: UDP-glucose/GDP-mannose dehydrogenase family protein [Cytophagales bacterium]|nr:UDP-glucose/GDP-mannose dehydrogenase family protein [Cytophagales bacterium]MDW8383472.1 UDP-glucose/GDP-mannose dehydrogenase family protein [Flammeovirgaceae bacterium]
MKIAVVGTGYVGLVSGTCFAEMGNHVICVDNNQEKIKKLKSGVLTIYEPGLEVLFERNTKAGRLEFTTNLAEAVKASTIIFLALPTPPGEDGSADLSYVLGVAEQLGYLIDDYKVIVDKSTVPVGTAEKVHATIAKNAKASFDVVSNPEFLREGVAVDDFMKPDRVIIGTTSEKARKIMQQLYEPFVRQGNPIYFMDERSAEMTKYAANSYLATRITFMNEIANLCERLGADVDSVRIGMGSDKRIGPRFLFPGVGYGGSCFPKDVQALGKMANEHDYDFRILDAVMHVNDQQKYVVANKIIKYFGKEIKGKKIAIWGLSFKPNTDDIREAPSIYTINRLLKEGAEIVAYDPEAMENMEKLFKNSIKFASDMYEAIDGADALAIITEWSVFRTPDFDIMKSKLKNPLIFDGRNVYKLEVMKEMGFYYDSIGRAIVKP